MLPSTAVLTDSEHARVIVATEGNVFRQRVVALGPEADGKVRVLTGIKPGEKVVVDGAISKRENGERLNSNRTLGLEITSCAADPRTVTLESPFARVVVAR